MSRKAIGFDVRANPLMELQAPLQLFTYQPSALMAAPPYPATISEPLWPRVESLAGKGPEYENGMLLFYRLADHDIPNDAIVVAFSVSTDDWQLLNGWQSIVVDETEQSLIDRGWIELGYDVADPYYSGFYGFTWEPGELERLFLECQLTFNRVGLLSDLETAERAARIFDQHIPEHAPFFPIKVMRQSSPAEPHHASQQANL
jgi:hypothetical protein